MGYSSYFVTGERKSSLGKQLVQSRLLACGFSPQLAASNQQEEEGDWNRKYDPTDFLIQSKTFCSGVQKTRLSMR